MNLPRNQRGDRIKEGYPCPNNTKRIKGCSFSCQCTRPRSRSPGEEPRAEDGEGLTTNHPTWSPGDGGVADNTAGLTEMSKITIDHLGDITQEPDSEGGKTKRTKSTKGEAGGRGKAPAGDTMSVFDFFKEIPDEAAARAFIEDVRWGDGVYCPHCTSENVYRRKSGKPLSHRCRTCKKYFSVLVNSAFHETNIPLQKWLYAIYLFHTGRAGVSSHELSRLIGVSQKYTWHMGHRIREGMFQSGEALSGEVEVDEMYVGGTLGRMHKDRREMLKETDPECLGKVIVMGIKERKTGRVWTTIVPSTELETLQRILGERIQPGATVYTDGHSSYEGIEFMFDFVHEVSYHNGASETIRPRKAGQERPARARQGRQSGAHPHQRDRIVLVPVQARLSGGLFLHEPEAPAPLP